MALIKYVPRKFTADRRRIIAIANNICEEYRQQGFDLTLRQLYYQFVARGVIPNNQQEYKRLGDTVNNARLAGVMDWDFIIDRTRNVRSIGHWTSPDEIVRGAAASWAMDLWRNQPERVEVWVEKDAIVGVIAGVCNELDVPYFSCRGYTSQSEMWAAAQRIGRHMARGQSVTVIHLGDHDPSGLDMSRDIEERLRMFTRQDERRAHVAMLRREVAAGRLDADADDYRDKASRLLDGREWAGFDLERIALNIDQIEEYDPPPNPVKQSDSRWERYVAETGLDESWELDALEPSVLADLIRGTVEAHRDDDAWEAAIDEQELHRTILDQAAAGWTGIAAQLITAQQGGDH